MALAVGDLVHPDPVQVVQPGGVEVIGHHPDHGPGHRLPGQTEEPRHRGLVGPLGEVADQVLEVPAEPRPGAGPGDLLGADPPAPRAAEPPDLGLQVQAAGPEVQVPPPPHPPVVGGAGPVAAGAPEPPPPEPEADHHPLRGEGHPGHRGPGDAEHGARCRGDAHVPSFPGKVGGQGPAEPTGGAVRARLSVGRKEISGAIDALLRTRIGGSAGSYGTHSNTRSRLNRS